MEEPFALRERLEHELQEILRQDVYIYGAGIVGKRLYQVIKNRKYQSRVKGFLVTEKDSDSPEYLEEKRILCLSDLKEENARILLAVSDVYQNEILCLLKRQGFCHVANGYTYSLLDEEFILDTLPNEIPDRIDISADELMMMQFEKGEFGRYDILYELLSTNIADEKVDTAQEIEVDAHMKICDSRRQMALLLEKRIPIVHIRQNYEKKADIYGTEWLKREVPPEMIAAIETVLRQRYKEWNHPFIGIMWPPAQAYFDDILRTLEDYADIRRFYDVEFEGDIRELVQSVYDTDDTEPRTIERKIKRIQKEEHQKLRIVFFTYREPGFRIKRYGHTISKYGVYVKRMLRNAFWDRIDDYVYDVIIHTTDNFEQTENVQKRLKRYMQRMGML